MEITFVDTKKNVLIGKKKVIVLVSTFNYVTLYYGKFLMPHP